MIPDGRKRGGGGLVKPDGKLDGQLRKRKEGQCTYSTSVNGRVCRSPEVGGGK